MKKLIQLKVNGLDEEVFIQPWWTLAQVLREQLGLTGTKISCGTGDCGACTVLINGKAVKSCIYPAAKAVGKEIITIEGLMSKDGKLHPLQEAFIEYFGNLCRCTGYTKIIEAVLAAADKMKGGS